MCGRLILAFLLAIMVLLPWQPAVRPAYAAGFTVNNTIDEPDAAPGDGVCFSTPSGKCTLRAAVMEANALPGPDSIMLPAGAYPVQLSDPSIEISSSIVVIGAGARQTIIKANLRPASGKSFVIAPSGSADISGVAFAGNGSKGCCGGSQAFENAGALILTDVVIRDFGSVYDGAGLANFGTATLSRVLFTNLFAGQIFLNPRADYGRGGAMFNSGSLTLTNVTTYRTFAGRDGNSIYNTGKLSIVNSTLANTRDSTSFFATEVPIAITNTIMWDRVDDTATSPVGPLANNGGQTDTLAPVPGSPAIDAGVDQDCASIDQRGVPRPIDGNGDGRPVCDNGAVEYVDPAGPLPASLCTPRPPVRVTTARAAFGELAVSIDGTGLENSLRTLRFTRTANAEVDLAGQPGRAGAFSVDLPPGTTHADIVIRRQQAGQAAMVRFVVVDRCGEWPSFVGGGPGAF